MKALLTSLSLLPFTLFAHPGHPGQEAHGDATHLLVGLAVATPILMIFAGFKYSASKKAAVKISKQD